MIASTLGSLLAISCAGLEGLAQVALKLSSRQPRHRFLWVMGGLSLFAVEAVLYTAALQRLDLSLAYSFGALSFVMVALFSAWLLRESIPVQQWIGVGCIVVGAGLLGLHA